MDNVEVSPNSKTERAGAIQIVCSLVSLLRMLILFFQMELSKDAIEDSESGGSDSDAWELVYSCLLTCL